MTKSAGLKSTILISAALFLSFNTAMNAQDIQYINATTLPLYGKPHVSGPHYHRVDTARYHDMPPSVKRLSTNGAGLVVAFKTTSKEIYARWDVKSTGFSNNMTAIAKSGLDLYIKKNNQWIFAGVARPGNDTSNTYKIVSNMVDGEKECLLFLPLYNELVKLEIGVEKGSTVRPLEIPWNGKVVIYGSSITQGASASRPGMAYPAQLARHLGYEFVNLGFSGNGKMEESVGRMVADIDDVDLFVLDCAANPSPEEIAERTENFVRHIRHQHPDVPILMIESVIREGGTFDQKIQEKVSDQNKNFRTAYSHLAEDGMQQLYLIKGDDLLGHDHEATTDGTHPNDLGFDRMLQVIEPKIREILD